MILDRDGERTDREYDLTHVVISWILAAEECSPVMPTGTPGTSGTAVAVPSVLSTRVLLRMLETISPHTKDAIRRTLLSGKVVKHIEPTK